MGAIAGAESREDRLRVRTDGLRAEAEALCDARCRLAVGVELKDLALAAGERRPADGATGRRIHEPLRFHGRVHGPVQRLHWRALDDVGGGTCLDRLRRGVILGLRPVSDDPEARLRLAQGADRGRSGEVVVSLLAVAVTQIDDRDVEVAERRQQLAGAVSVLGLLHILSAYENLALHQAT